jgi:hypothetical protein
MTIDELEDQLPNGFHDAEIVNLSTNFLTGTCCLELDVDYSDPGPTGFRRMKLNFDGVSLLILEAPKTKGLSLTKKSICASGYATTEEMLSNLESYRKNAPSGTFFYSFFLKRLNCSIHIGALGAALEPTS